MLMPKEVFGYFRKTRCDPTVCELEPNLAGISANISVP